MALQERSGSGGLGVGLETVADSTALKVAVIGVLLWGAAVFLNPSVWPFEVYSYTGVWAAILAIWGTALIIVGVGLYALVWWFHQ